MFFFQHLQVGMDVLTWKDIGVGDFVEAAVHIICNELFQTVQTIQEILKSIKDIVDSWSYGLMDVFLQNKHSKPCIMEAWIQKQRQGKFILIDGYNDMSCILLSR